MYCQRCDAILNRPFIKYCHTSAIVVVFFFEKHGVCSCGFSVGVLDAWLTNDVDGVRLNFTSTLSLLSAICVGLV